MPIYSLQNIGTYMTMSTENITKYNNSHCLFGKIVTYANVIYSFFGDEE